MARYLLNLHFDKFGPIIDNTAVNLGGVSYDDPSVIKSGGKSAYFKPYNDFAGLFIPNGNDIATQLNRGKDFTIYTKYKIDSSTLTTNGINPILSTRYPSAGNFNTKGSIPSKNYTLPILYIENGEYFTFLAATREKFSSKIIDYTFDNKWHTLTVTRKGNILRFFIDGCLSTTNTIGTKPASYVYNQFFIGYSQADITNVSTFNGGWLDDITILDFCMYDSTFIPPTQYIGLHDDINNYYLGDISNTYELEDEVKDQVEYKIRAAVHHFNEAQKGWLPHRVRIEWFEKEDSYFRNMDYMRDPLHRTYTILSLYNMINPLLGDDKNRFFEGNAWSLFNKGQIQAFMLVVDKKFIPLSRLYIIRSDWWYTVFIYDRDPEVEGRIQSVEFVTIPFQTIYEERCGEREDLIPIYEFNKDGTFDTTGGASYIYYIDETNGKVSNIGTSGIYEQNIPSYMDDKNSGDDEYKDSEFMHFVWRYGRFEEVCIVNDDLLVQFRAWDHGYVKPGDTVMIYKNTILIDPDRYDIVGHDLVRFYNYKELNVMDNLFTMCIVTDSNDEWLNQDFTDTKYIRLTPTMDEQSVFQLPPDIIENNKKYNHFLIFRGSVCIENENRYILDTVNNTLTFTNTADFVRKDTDVLMIWCHLNESGVNGPLHLKPIYLYTQTEDQKSGRLKIPDLNGLQFNMNNVMLFIQDTFIVPKRYRIEDNTLYMMDPNDYFEPQSTAVFVTFKIVDELEDPTTPRFEVIKNQLEQGKRFVLYDLGVDKHIKLTLDNFTVFDNHGEYVPDLYGQVYNRNIIKCLYTDDPLVRVPRYLTVLYLKDHFKNEANCILPSNDGFINSYIGLFEEFYEMDDHFQEFMSDFNTRYYRSNHYGENLSRALDFMMCYNQSKFDKVYERYATAYRIDLDRNKFNMALTIEPDNTYSIDMETGEFKESTHRTYCMFFLNGMIPDWQNNITYSGNTMHLRLPFRIGYSNKEYFKQKVYKDYDSLDCTLYVVSLIEEGTPINSDITCTITVSTTKRNIKPIQMKFSKTEFIETTKPTNVIVKSNPAISLAAVSNTGDSSIDDRVFITVEKPALGEIYINGELGSSFLFNPGEKVRVEAIPYPGYKVNALWINTDNQTDQFPIPVDSFEVIKIKGINNYLQKLNKRIKYINHIVEEFIVNMAVGREYNKDFQVKFNATPLTIDKNTVRAKFTVERPFVLPKTYQNIEFKSKVTVKKYISTYFNCRFEVYKRPGVPNYTPPKGMYCRYYEIYCKMVPGYEFKPIDLVCTFKVPVSIIPDN